MLIPIRQSGERTCIRKMSSKYMFPLFTEHLANGMTLVVSSDHAVPAVAVNLSYRIGSRDDPPGRSGSAHLLEHLMFQGTARVKRGEYEKLIRSSGGSCNARTGFDRTAFVTRVPAGALDLALWLEADRMVHLSDGISDARVDIQRRVVEQERRQNEEAAPFGSLFRRTLHAMFPPGHPYHHPPMGMAGDLDRISTDELRTLHRRYYQPANCVLSMCGAIRPAQAVRAAERYFGKLGGENAPGSAAAFGIGGREWLAAPACRDDVHGSRDGSLAQFAFLLPTGTSAALAAEAALLALGQGAASRLYRRLVQAEGIAVYVTAEISQMARAALGLLRVRPARGIDPGTLADRMQAEIDSFVADGPDPDEYAAAVAHLEREWLQQMASSAGRADEIAQAVLRDGFAEAVRERTRLVTALPLGQVRAAGRRYLGDGRQARVIYHAGSREGQR
jgi:zinc protease